MYVRSADLVPAPEIAARESPTTAACQLRRPVATPARMIEPQLVPEQQPLESIVRPDPSSNVVPIRLLDTQARGHVGRRILRQQPQGENAVDG